MNKTVLIIISLIIGIILSAFYFNFFGDINDDWPEPAKCNEAFVQKGIAEMNGVLAKPSQQIINRLIEEAKNDANMKANLRCPNLCPPVFLLWEKHSEFFDGPLVDSLGAKYIVWIRGSYQCLKPPVGD
ncbi:hypothetical protein ACFLSQ_03565 [Bacteroidota bacterium]